MWEGKALKDRYNTFTTSALCRSASWLWKLQNKHI